MNEREVYGLAERVAREIRDGFESYDGSRWQQIEGHQRPIQFSIQVPSLKGKRADGLRLERGVTGNFGSKVGGAEASSYRNAAGYTRSIPVLHDVHFDIQVENGVCTGEVLVSEASAAWNF